MESATQQRQLSPPSRATADQQTVPEAQPPKLAAAKSKRPFLILGAVAAAVLLGVIGYLVLTAGHESTDDAQVESDVVPIAPRVAGQVKRVLVQDNQQVKKGELRDRFNTSMDAVPQQ